jgi:hypothetical protein
MDSCIPKEEEEDDEGFLQFTVASVGAGHDIKLNK